MAVVRVTRTTIDLPPVDLVGPPAFPVSLPGAARLVLDDPPTAVFVSLDANPYTALGTTASIGWTRTAGAPGFVALSFPTDRLGVGGGDPGAGVKMRITGTEAPAPGQGVLEVIMVGEGADLSTIAAGQVRTGGLGAGDAQAMYSAALIGDAADAPGSSLAGYFVPVVDRQGGAATFSAYGAQRDPTTLDEIDAYGAMLGQDMRFLTFDDGLAAPVVGLDCFFAPGSDPVGGIFGSTVFTVQDGGSNIAIFSAHPLQTAPLIVIEDALANNVVEVGTLGGYVASANMVPGQVRMMLQANVAQAADLFQTTDDLGVPELRMDAMGNLIQEPTGPVGPVSSHNFDQFCRTAVGLRNWRMEVVGGGGDLYEWNLNDTNNVTVVALQHDNATGGRELIVTGAGVQLAPAGNILQITNAGLLAFFGVAPVVQQATVPAKIDATTGAAAPGCIPVPPVGGAGATAAQEIAINDNFATVLELLNALKVALNNVGITVG